MRHAVPDGDLGAIIEQAVTEKLERLESRRFAKTKTPRKTASTLEPTDTRPRSRHVPAVVKRAVYERTAADAASWTTVAEGAVLRERSSFTIGTPMEWVASTGPERAAVDLSSREPFP
jgi:hypothetical protein